MKPLDSAQQRELEWLRSQPSAWVNMSTARRFLIAVLLVVVLPLTVAGIAALAGGPWLVIGGLVMAVMTAVVLPHAVFPERMLRRAARRLPSEDSMRRGDKPRQNWPG